MRIKNKFYCDYCGKYLKNVNKKQMEEINKSKQEGTRLSYITQCTPTCC
jgi:hypothetical protein